MTLFKGYAETKGFRPVKVPDLSDKIRQQGLTKMRGMENALAANVRQDQRIVHMLERNAQIEKENRDTNFELKMNYRDTLAKAEWKNAERAIKNEEIKRKNKQRDLKALLSMVPTGIKLVKAMDAKRKAGIDNMARDIYDKYGIGSRRWELIRKSDDAIWKPSMHKEGFLSHPDLAHDIPIEVRDRIRRSGGYATLKVAELEAQRLGRRMESVYLDNWNTKFKIAGQEISLADAEGEVEEEILRRISNQEREKVGENWPSTNLWFSSGAHELNDRAKASIRKIKAKNQRERALDAQHDDEISTIKHQIGRNNGQGIWSGPVGIQSSIMFYAGGPNASREQLQKSRTRVTAAVVHALKTGQLDWEDVKGLETLELNVRGSTKPVLWGDHFSSDWRQIENAGLAAAVADNKAALIGSKTRDTADLQMREKMIELELSGEAVSPGDWAKFAGIAQSKGYNKTHGYIVKQISTGQNAEMDTVNGIILKARMDRGEIVTDNEIDQLQLSDDNRALAKQQARKNNAFLPGTEKNGHRDRLKERIDAELKRIIPKQNSWSWNASHNDAAIAAINQASSHYRTHFSKHNNQEEAYIYARDMITKDIRDPDGRWSEGEINSDGIREFKGFQADTTRKRIKADDPVQLKLELGGDPSLIYHKPYIEEIDIRNKAARLHRGLRTGVLPRTQLLRSMTGLKTIDILLGQREYWANKEIAEKGHTTIPEIPEWYINEARAAEDIMSSSPRVQRLLSYYSPGYVNQAAVQSGANVVYTKPLYDKVRPMALQLSGGDYDSMGQGLNSYETKGYTLVGSTIRDILEIFEAGNLEVAGAYHLNSEQITQAAEAGGLSYDRLFDSKTQDILFDLLFKSGSYQLPETENEYDSILIDSISKNINGDKVDSSEGYHTPYLLNSKALAYLNRQGRYATA